MLNETYWTHNTAYHKWILSCIEKNSVVLDVGCGDGLLILRLSEVCGKVAGIDPDAAIIKSAEQRLCDIPNATVQSVGFEEYEAAPETFDVIIFVASMHHMEHEFCMKKAKRLLKPGGILLVVGCAKRGDILDFLIDVARVLLARIGSAFHGEPKSGIGVSIKEPEVSFREIKRLAKRIFRNVKMRQGLYYRYLLSCEKSKEQAFH